MDTLLWIFKRLLLHEKWQQQTLFSLRFQTSRRFQTTFFSFRGRLKASKQPDFKLLCFYPLYIPLTAFTDPTTGVPDLPARL